MGKYHSERLQDIGLLINGREEMMDKRQVMEGKVHSDTAS